MMNDDRDIARLKKFLNSKPFSSTDMVTLVVQMRVLIEKYKLSKEFPVLNYYCHWAVHPKLDRDLTCLKTLDYLTSVLVKFTSDRKLKGEAYRNAFYREINKAVGIDALYQEMNLFLKHFDIEDHLISSSQFWMAVYKAIISNMLDRPIEIPEVENINDKRVKEIYDSIHERANGDPKRMVMKFLFTDDPRSINNNFKAEQWPKGIYWVMVTKANVSIISMLPT